MNENQKHDRSALSHDSESRRSKQRRLSPNRGSAMPLRSLSVPAVASVQPNNPLHGVKLADMIEYLVEQYGWEELGKRVPINCFNSNPSIKSSLKFLRKTPWARDKVEQFFLYAKRKRQND